MSARIIWHAALDPSTLLVDAFPAAEDNPDAIVPPQLDAWLTIVRDIGGQEHGVLTDGQHHLRVDVGHGSLQHGPVVLRYNLAGLVGTQPKLLTLRRLLFLCTRGTFSRKLFPADPRIARGVLALRVYDALRAGASQREIAETLFGQVQGVGKREGASDSLRLRVRRLVRDAETLSRGTYRALLRGDVARLDE